MSNANAYAIEIRGLTKRYGPTLANDGVDLAVTTGEIHGLLGENGAGKSTVVHAIAGILHPDEGAIRIHGHALLPGSPKAALEAGVGLVAQHFSLVPTLTVWENIILGREPVRWGFVDREQARNRAKGLIDQLGVDLHVDDEVSDLPIGSRQIVEILKALDHDASLLILDEPTSTLSPAEADRLFDLVGQLRERGTTVLLVTHRITDILEHADRATVLRSGRVALRAERRTWTEADLVRAIVGDRTTATGPTTDNKPERPILRVVDLSTREGSSQNLESVSFEVGEGEVVGVAGVAGNGQETLVRVLVGLLPAYRGQLVFGDQDVTRATVGERRKIGIAYIPEDRHGEGMVDAFSVADNLLLGNHTSYGHIARIDHQAVRAQADRLIEAYDVRGPGPDAPMGQLSGGNQQKVIVARALSNDPKLVVAAQPTRGLDLAAAAEIRARFTGVTRNGGCVVVTSADLEELFILCNRIVVLYAGRIAGQALRPDFDRDRLGRLMTLGRDDA